jgi:hypothetical protein
LKDKTIRHLLQCGFSPQQIAAEYALPLRRVVRVQTCGESAHRPDETKPPPVGFRLPKGVTPATAPTEGYAPYWQEWDAAHGRRVPVVRPRAVRMVPDDRRDEEIDFAAVINGGRGAA